MPMRWLVVAVACLPARPAEACSCGVIPHVLSPADGATGVPTNAIVVVDDVLPADGLFVSLQADGASAPLAVAYELFAAPSAPGLLVARAGELDPMTAYAFSFGIGSEVLTTRFTTGLERDATPPPYAGLSAFTPEQQAYPAPALSMCQSSCVEAVDGMVNRLRLQHLPGDGVIWYRLEVRRADAAAPFYDVPLTVDEVELIRPFECATRAPVLEGDGAYCARLTAYDAAGNAAGGDVEVCHETVTCKARDVDCAPVDECVPVDGCGCALRPGTPAGGSGLLLLALAVLRRRGRRG